MSGLTLPSLIEAAKLALHRLRALPSVGWAHHLTGIRPACADRNGSGLGKHFIGSGAVQGILQPGIQSVDRGAFQPFAIAILDLAKFVFKYHRDSLSQSLLHAFLPTFLPSLLPTLGSPFFKGQDSDCAVYAAGVFLQFSTPIPGGKVTASREVSGLSDQALEKTSSAVELFKAFFSQVLKASTEALSSRLR
jgi:hypothetical protein